MTRSTDQARDAVGRLSLEEKLDLGVGKDMWHTKAFPEAGIASLAVADGPSGVRHQKKVSPFKPLASQPATCFPTLATLAASWNPRLAREVGEAIGEEAKRYGVGVVLGPGLNIKRNPLGGRNFEYLSEDPLLAGTLAAAWVAGAQSTGTGACPKHFAANSQEYHRMASDSVIDERTLREIYLPAFERVVREARPEMLMNAYNKVNGTYCSDHRHLLREILRDEWGFDGVVVTDWGAMHERGAAYRAGCDLAMPGGSKHHQKQTKELVESRRLPEALVDESAARLAALASRHSGLEPGELTAADVYEHRHTAHKAAVEGHVLLANNGLLPLAEGARVALIGPFAAAPRYQGAGSSQVEPLKVATLVEACPAWTHVAGARPDGTTDETLLAEAAQAAQDAEAAVVVIGLPAVYESEGYDRENLDLPEGFNQLVEAVAEANPRTVAVLQCASPLVLPWAEQVAAIVYAGLGGEAGAQATRDILTGVANPSGRLPETWPANYSDVASRETFGAPNRQTQYREGVFVGYRHYASAGIRVAYPFGHGLSYSDFEYSNLKVDGRTVSFTVKNVGSRTGAEIAQVYLTPPAGGLARPKLALAGFKRVWLQPKDSARVILELEERAFQVWRDGWVTSGGTYEVKVGASSEDIRLTGSVAVAGETVAAPEGQAGSWYETFAGTPSVQDFEVLLGGPVPPARIQAQGTWDTEATLADLAADSKVVELATKAIAAATGKIGSGADDPVGKFLARAVLESPLFALENVSGGRFHRDAAKWLVRRANKPGRL